MDVKSNVLDSCFIRRKPTIKLGEFRYPMGSDELNDQILEKTIMLLMLLNFQVNHSARPPLG